ncbi:hypothetical protein D1007_34476 [Hordeum vulgare]|nr:hypothetical protein D1007_34476 [Hordeum vulgare]
MEGFGLICWIEGEKRRVGWKEELVGGGRVELVGGEAMIYEGRGRRRGEKRSAAGLGEDKAQNDPLVLTGPKRGLMIFDSIIFEVDLKVNDVNGRKVNDKRVSRGLMEINGIFRLSFPPKYIVQTKKLVSMHSTLDLNYTFVRKAVEGTIEMRILEAGPVNFHGKIIARTSSFPCDIMLHDSKLAGMLTAGEDGILQTARRVVSVSVDETLLLTVAIAADGVYTVEFTPKRGGYDEERIAWGGYKMLVKVTWSVVHR